MLIFKPDDLGNIPGSPIRHLEFQKGNFFVTWFPVCTYKDYWGKVIAEEQTGTIRLEIKRGNYIPKDFAGHGRYRFGPEDELIVTGISFGTKKDEKTHASYVFRRLHALRYGLP